MNKDTSKEYSNQADIIPFRDRIKDMTFEQKLDYILTYYWGRLLLVILIPIILAVGLFNILKPKPDLVFSGTCSNLSMSVEGQDYLVNLWKEQLAMDPDEVSLKLSFTQTDGMAATDMDGGLQVLASVAANNLDYILCDKVAMEYYSRLGAYIPADQILPEQSLEEYGDRLYYITDEEQGITFASGVDISQMAFIRDCISPSGPVYLMFAKNENANSEFLQTFWFYLQAWEAE